jgi:hypothetical protein
LGAHRHGDAVFDRISDADSDRNTRLLPLANADSDRHAYQRLHPRRLGAHWHGDISGNVSSTDADSATAA